MKQQDLTFETSWRNEDHNWGRSGSKITSEENLSNIKTVLENIGSIIVEHWIYCGSQAPKRSIFDDYDEFIDYLKINARAGDIVHVWSMHEILNDQNQLVSGKCPAEDGCIPEEGSY